MKQHTYESSPFQEGGNFWNLKQAFENEVRVSDAFWRKALPKMMRLIDINSEIRTIKKIFPGRTAHLGYGQSSFLLLSMETIYDTL